MEEKERHSALEVAAQIIAAVRGTTIAEKRGDTAAQVMHGAYVRALRRFERIRQMAVRGYGDETMILTRSLLSLVGRALWVDRPSDPEERRARWESYAKRQLADRLVRHEAMKKHGFAVDDAEIEFDREELKRFDHARDFPNDRLMLEDLGLEVWYDRLYRGGSDYVHLSLSVAVDELRDTEEVHFDADHPEVAHEGLCLAVLVYGHFLHLSEKTVQHGLTQHVLNITESSDAFATD